MQDKIKNIIITIGFVLTLFAVLFTNIIVEDKKVSMSEKRKLAQFSYILKEIVTNKKVIEKWEEYVEDQFVGRDFFRRIKAEWSMNVFAQKDYNGLLVIDDAIYKMKYILKEGNVQKSAEKIKFVYEKYLKGMDVYYSIIPEKDYYLDNDEYLKMDYESLENIIKIELKELQYIDITEVLELEDYYRTDTHWKQECLQDVVKTLQKQMGLDEIEVKYEWIDKGEFRGGYYGQYGGNVTPDTIYTLTNDTIKNCVAYDFEAKKNVPIYVDANPFDMYDTFLRGASPVPIVSIENPNSKTEKELLLFRDSFGSSLAPLLLENYSKITLIDLRYISKEILGDYIEFKDQDVLFLNNSSVLNNNTFI